MKRDELAPIGKVQEPDLVKYVKERAYRSSPLYAGDFSNARKAELYDQGDQWLRRAHTTRDSRYPSQWIRMDSSNDPNALPLPVYNEMVALRENESARLGRPEYKPRVRAKGENPDITAREGAKGAERALLSRQKSMGWDEEQEKLCYNMPMYGGSWLLSYWDQDWMDTVRVPAKAVICEHNPKLQEAQAGPPSGPPPPAPAGPPPEPGLEAMPAPELGAAPVPAFDPFEVAGLPPEAAALGQPADELGPTASPGGVSPEAMPELPQAPELMAPEGPAPCPFVSTADKVQGEMCPLCQVGRLQPYQPTMEEAQGELGKDWPKGDWRLRVLAPYGVFPRDAGIGVDQRDVDEWVWAHTETIDWLAERYPDKVRDETTGEFKIHAEHPSTLMAEDPTLGAPLTFQGAQYSTVYANHVMVYEYFRHPWLEWDKDQKVYKRNRGRHSVVAGDRVCIDTTYLVDSLNEPDKTVARAKLQFIMWEPKEGGRRTTVGQSLWDRLFDAQDGINERKAQIRAVNQRGALPWYLQARGRNFETRAADSAVPFRRVMVDIDPTDKQPPLQLMQNTTIDGGVYTEIDQDLQYAQRTSGQVEVERGQVPPNVAAATAIAYLKTESGEKRRPRIRRIRGGLIRGWEHGLELMSAFYIEPREYSYEDEQQEQRWAFIHGEVIASANPKVDVYPAPDYDIVDSQRENIRDMVQLGILDPKATPQLNRKIVKMLEPSFEFFIEDDLQEQQADREWRDFKDNGRVPVIDPGLDDPMTHYQAHGQECFSVWFREQERMAGWDAVLSILGAEWDQLTVQVAMMSPPGTSLQTLLLQAWMQRIGQAVQQGLMAPPQDGEALNRILQWRAHMEAHKLKALLSQFKAPGTGSTPPSQSEQPGAAPGAGAPPGGGPQ